MAEKRDIGGTLERIRQDASDRCDQIELQPLGHQGDFQGFQVKAPLLFEQSFPLTRVH
jgi:hypothetical protein